MEERMCLIATGFRNRLCIRLGRLQYQVEASVLAVVTIQISNLGT